MYVASSNIKFYVGYTKNVYTNFSKNGYTKIWERKINMLLNIFLIKPLYFLKYNH